MKLRYLALINALILAVPLANAAATFNIQGSVGGAPVGVSKLNFDALTVGSKTGALVPVVSGPAVVVNITTTGDAGIVNGTNNAPAPRPNYAAPFLSGGNGLGFGNPGDQADGPDITNYVATGGFEGVPTSSVILEFGTPQLYFGILWGSVDNGPTIFNKLEFFSNNVSIGVVDGGDVAAAPNGDQGVNGTLYVNITSSLPFNKVIASSSGTNSYTFEFDNLALSPQIPCSGCTYTQGWYKNHSNWPALPAGGLTLGLTEQYTKAELQSILGAPVKGNGLISLAHQLITAKLNALRGACVPAAVATAIAQADIKIGNRVVPPVGNGSLTPAETSALTNILDQYNNGNAPGGPQHCD
jgi:hypothetical protein